MFKTLASKGGKRVRAGATAAITSLTGDVTATGPGAAAAALAASGVVAATYGDATHVPQIAVDAKGRITSASDVAISGAGSGPPTLLTYVSYNPGTTQDATTSSSTGADVDATNLTVSFTVPASGKVLVVLVADGYQSAGNYYAWCLRDTGGSNISGTIQVVDAASSIEGRKTAHIFLSGLTPGASLTYRWGFLVSGGTAHLRYGSGSPNIGPAVMEVWDATTSRSVTYAAAQCTINTNGTANVPVAITGCSLSLGAGTWLIWGQAAIQISGADSYCYVDVYDGSAVQSSAQNDLKVAISTVGYAGTAPLVMVLGGATTITLRFATGLGGASSVALATAGGKPTTGIFALQLA